MGRYVDMACLYCGRLHGGIDDGVHQLPVSDWLRVVHQCHVLAVQGCTPEQLIDRLPW